MIVESGLIVALGMILLFFKCNWRTRIAILSKPLTADLIVFVLLNALHWGTFSGVMVAAVGSLVCSGMITVGRWGFGYKIGNMYYPGVKNVADKLRVR